MDGELQGKIGLVTGAGMGMGAAIARAYVGAGAAVGVLDVDGDAAQRTAEAIAADGGEALAVVADVSVESDVRRAVGQVVELFGGVDVLANNAGVVRYGELPDFPEEDWDFVLGVNLKGPYLLARHTIPSMRERGGGAIVNIASVQAFASERAVAAYTASKGGLVAMTRTLALDHAEDRIRVNAVGPGSVRTPMLEYGAERFGGDRDETIAGWGRRHPIGRVIEPAEIAEVVLFLSGPRASAVTGATWLADGGLSAGLPL